jgi:tetratricopeptide (TPR) repeat protein
MKENRFMKMRVVAVLPLLVLLSCASGGNSGTKATEEPTSGISLDEAIEQSAREFKEKTASPKRIAIVQFDTEAEALSEYIMEEITWALVNFDFEVAERKNLDFVRKELDLQYSGEVDDETMVEIGRFIGAESVLVGELLKVGNTYRYRLSSIGVEKAVREAAVRLDVRNDSAFKAVLESLRSQKPAVPKPVAQPKTAGAFLDRGILFAARGDFALAIEDFSETIKLKPDFASAYLLRARALQASVSKIESIAEDFSSFDSVSYGVKNNYTAANKPVYDKALADINTAIKLDDTSFNAYFLRGEIYDDMGDYDRAIADFNQALKRNPNSVSTYNRRGLVYYKKDDYEKAVADYTQAINIAPNYNAPYNNRGNVYEAKEDYDRAIADYTQAIRLDPNDAGSYNNRGNAYLNRGLKGIWDRNYDYEKDYDNAIADYTQAIRLRPDDAIPYGSRGYAYRRKDDNDRAIADFTQAIKIDPDDAFAYYWRGFEYSKKKNYDSAIADFTQAIRINQNDANAYYSRGGAYSQKGMVDRAIEDYTAGLRITPSSGYYNILGKVYYDKGMYDRAIENYTAALRLYSENTEVYVWRGNAYWMKGDKTRARADWSKARELDKYGWYTKDILER